MPAIRLDEFGLDALAEAMGRAHEQGARLVVTSGHYNPLTAGHLEYLSAAGSPRLHGLGGLHLAIVNSDQQVALKGSCPFMPEKDRLRLVAAMACVDFAVLATDRGRCVSDTLRTVHASSPRGFPIVFVNGGDVGPGEVREDAACRVLGIELLHGVGGALKLRSSSELIRNAALWLRDRGKLG